MSRRSKIPRSSYGILEQNQLEGTSDRIVEQIRELGYAILDSKMSADELTTIGEEFDAAHRAYSSEHSESRLRETGEINTIRCPLALGYESFLNLAFNAPLMAAIERLILGAFVLNQQNGVINPPRQSYNQGAWHRDLPYQHFTTSRPIAINALFCVDPFTEENGATFVLPASHKSESLPSPDFIAANAVQIEAAAGSFILLDCMTFHAGGRNETECRRRAVNHIYGIPHLRQQIRIPKLMDAASLSPEQCQILGFGFEESDSIAAYLETRKS